MNQKRLDLAARQGALRMRIAMQREALSHHSVGLAVALARGDQVIKAVDWLKHHPLAVGAAVTAAVVARPGKVWRWTRRGFFLWRGWQALRSSILGRS